MEFFAGYHAQRRMRLRRITHAMLDHVLEHPHRVEHQRGLVFRYYGMVDGEEFRVVVAFDV